jgi:hypothetical protein
MDLYYGRMHEEFSARSHKYPKDCPKTFQKHMKAYHFLSQHPKYKVESPTDGSKPPPKNLNSIRKGHVPEELEDAFNDNEESNTFV